MAQRKSNNGFRPRQSYHAPALKPGAKLEPRVDNSEEVIAANPVMSGYVTRYGQSASQPRVRYEAYSAGWQDAFAAFTQMFDVTPKAVEDGSELTLEESAEFDASMAAMALEARALAAVDA